MEREKLFCICHCSDFDPKELEKKAPIPFLEKLKNSVDFTSIYGSNMLGNYYVKTGELPDDTDDEDVQACLDFLLMQKGQRGDDSELCKKYSSIQNHSIWRFIEGYLGINMDSTYDYLLMNYLEEKGYMDHGSGIRAGWAGSGIKREINKEREEKILAWATR